MGLWERSPRAAGRERDAGVAAPETSHTLRRGYRGLTTGDAVRLRHWGLTAGLQNPSIPSCDASDCTHLFRYFTPPGMHQAPSQLKSPRQKGDILQHILLQPWIPQSPPASTTAQSSFLLVADTTLSTNSPQTTTLPSQPLLCASMVSRTSGELTPLLDSR